MQFKNKLHLSRRNLYQNTLFFSDNREKPFDLQVSGRLYFNYKSGTTLLESYIFGPQYENILIKITKECLKLSITLQLSDCSLT